MNPAKTYKCLDQIGRGSYATVHKAINTRTGEICAIKKINVAKELNCQTIKNEISIIKNEISIMCECKCDNIVRLIGSEVNENEVWLVMEYCLGGSVKDAMRELTRTITEEEMVLILKGVLTGLEYLHANAKIHRDVKAANILLNEDGLAKLGDFGVSEPLELASTKAPQIIGTPLWLAPEVIKEETYSQSLDIWSLGITIIEMGEGQPPYSQIDQTEAWNKIADSSIPAPTFRDPSNWSPGLVDFLSQCLVKDASHRASAQKMLQHEIFKNPTSDDALKRLVTEVCSTAKSTETRLAIKLDYLLVEEKVLNETYVHVNSSIREVIEVDHLTQMLSQYKSEFERMDTNIKDRDGKIGEIRKHLKSLSNDISRLERDRNDLSATLRTYETRRDDIVIQLGKIREKQKSLESESERRMKLWSLEERIT